MSKENLKKEIHRLIDDTEDEKLLNMVKEDLVTYSVGSKKIDDLSDLSPEDKAELEEQFNEDPMKDTVGFEEFKAEMKEWLSRL